jgi:hypothetical protein
MLLIDSLTSAILDILPFEILIKHVKAKIIRLKMDVDIT